MRLSVQCAGLPDVVPDHGKCDGTAFGNAAGDAALMASLPEGDWSCACPCHRELADAKRLAAGLSELLDLSRRDCAILGDSFKREKERAEKAEAAFIEMYGPDGEVLEPGLVVVDGGRLSELEAAEAELARSQEALREIATEDEPVQAHVLCDAETHLPTLASDEEISDIEDCLGTAHVILDCWIRPPRALSNTDSGAVSIDPEAVRKRYLTDPVFHAQVYILLQAEKERAEKAEAALADMTEFLRDREDWFESQLRASRASTTSGEGE